MHDMQEREKIMQRDVLLVAVAGASLLAGLPGSPLLFPVFVLLRPFLAGTIFGGELVMTYLASFLTSATVALIAGVPAALYERAKGLTDSTTPSLLIWFLCTLTLASLPYMLIGWTG
jgi:hypothetical protein